MLYIYTNQHIPKGLRLISDADSEYWRILNKNWDELKNDKTLLRFYTRIDKAKVTKEFYLKTEFGYASMFECCHGTKAAIVAYYYRNRPDILINITECGKNAVEFMASLKDNLYTYDSNNVTYGLSNKKVILNGELMTIRQTTAKIAHEKFEGNTW